MTAASLTVRLNANDNVVVARTDPLPGVMLAGEGLAATQRIPAGHKVATRPIPAGEPVRKFDQIIGFATRPIGAGEHVHVHNCGMAEFDRDYAVGQAVRPPAMVPEAERAAFPGYLRANGKVGTRNFIGILSTVNCSASVAKFIAERFPAEVLAHYPNVDGIVAITHGTGCGMADQGEGYATLQRTLWGFAAHPNFAAILMIGLGCEVMQLSFMKEVYGIESGPAFRTMTVSPGRTSLAATWSWLCSVAMDTVEPATRTGSITPNGVTRPVRPTFTSIASSRVLTSSGGYL